MISGFSKKKISHEATLAERLKSRRLEKGVSLLEAESATKVRAKYLAALESGNWRILPQAVYARGFVLAYARYLEQDLSQVLRCFERELSVYGKHHSGGLSYSKTIREARVLITPRLLAYSALCLFVVSMFSYIVYQVAGFAGTPDLKIVTPKDNTVIPDDSLDITGITNSDAVVLVNDESVPVTSDGRFSLNLRLHRGVNVINVRAVNKAKKESSRVYTVEYRPQTASISSDQSIK
ncbi:MAG: helix-turn-helix domain-containing protein [Patescibacteria group bacterium]|jgi:cytoskeletal protein RodZ